MEENMKKFKLLFIAVLIGILAPFNAIAGTLVIDWTTGTDTTASGDTIFQVASTSGTYTTGIATGDTVIPNLSNYGSTFSAQINSLGFGPGMTAALMSGATYEIVAQFSNINDAAHWTGASEYVLNPGGTAANSGTSLIAKSSDPGVFEYMRLLLREALGAVSPYGTVTARTIHK